jgi:hypothetical protein
MAAALSDRTTTIALRRSLQKGGLRPMSVDPVSVILLTLGALALAAIKAAITVLVLRTPARKEH